MSARPPRLLLLVRTARRNAVQDAHQAGAPCVAGNMSRVPGKVSTLQTAPPGKGRRSRRPRGRGPRRRRSTRWRLMYRPAPFHDHRRTAATRKAGVSIGTVLCWRAPTPRDLQSRSASQPAARLRRSPRCGAAARYDGGGLSVAAAVIQPWSAEPRKAVEAACSGDVVEFLDRMEGQMKQAAFPAALLAGLALVGCQQADSPAEHTPDSEGVITDRRYV